MRNIKIIVIFFLSLPSFGQTFSVSNELFLKFFQKNNGISNSIRLDLNRESLSGVSNTIYFGNEIQPNSVTISIPEITSSLKVTDSKYALIIGNSSYQHVAKLKNPKNDADKMNEALTSLGFKTIVIKDGTKNEIYESIKEFSEKAKDATVTLFYFAGHGVQIDGKNYLIPVESKLETKFATEIEGINVDIILRSMEMTSKSGRMNIIILDACRNNPFLSWNRGGEVGLAGLNPPSGSLIAYSTSPNSVASDGEGDNGLYTSVLLNELLKNQRIEDVFINTRIKVEKLTNNSQSPWELARLRGVFSLFD